MENKTVLKIRQKLISMNYKVDVDYGSRKGMMLRVNQYCLLNPKVFVGTDDVILSNINKYLDKMLPIFKYLHETTLRTTFNNTGNVLTLSTEVNSKEDISKLIEHIELLPVEFTKSKCTTDKKLMLLNFELAA